MTEVADYKGYELPAYEVERVEDSVELRRYAPHLAAQVCIAGDRATAINRGFRVLARYIFGGNSHGRKVAMTVPVTQAPDGADHWVVRFMMPAGSSAETLPPPNDSRIQFVTVPASRQAVRRFSGWPTSPTLERQSRDLGGWIAARGLPVAAGPLFYFYDSPMTLPWNRRNEVAFRLADS
ncbi:heme-binding protein [Cereibacter sphaeroides]|uniref:SOUL family heme-binding protein n=1 Tax=Rhodobacterales TaxID=204455 RepID=UPI000BBF2B33|nr:MULTISPECIES: heme-binding protein [Paracoccaceae]MCE6959900.1 heme-binding protein [Cereibacter sphaeroides]MCE6968469.1 heme-binding protein [Cereibacter sphaeroides]MCE6972985.1 heme-binding protein [Cereibacter sphaeroides]